METQEQTKIFSEKWASKDSFDRGKFSFDNNQIKNIGVHGSYLLGEKSFFSQFQFSVRVDSIEKNFYIGICDIKYATKENLGKNNILFSNEGALLKEFNKIDSNCPIRLKNGDEIEVTGNLQQGEVSWKVNGQLACTSKWERLKDDKVQWVPVLYMNKCIITILNSWEDVNLFLVDLTEKFFNWDEDILYEIIKIIEFNPQSGEEKENKS